MAPIRETLSRLKHSGPRVLRCPVCGSPDLKPFSSLDSWLVPERYVCGSCGYCGAIVLEADATEEPREAPSSDER